MIKQWFLEARPQFLVLSVLLVIEGSALAHWQGSFSWKVFFLSLFALLCLHASVNVLNDWHDFKSGIDRLTRRTPFSGGSGFLPLERMSPGEVLTLGIVFLALGTGTGIVLLSRGGWLLLVFGLVGVVSVVTYTPLLSHLGLGEVFAGLGLGTLPVLGVFLVHSGSLSPEAWIASVPAGLLTFNLLLLNEFPDTDADREGGRKHLVILLGKERAGWLYSLVEIMVYVHIAWAGLSGALPRWVLVGLLALPLALKAIKGALKDYESFEDLIPAQGANVAAVLATNLLLGIGFLIAA